MTITPHVPATDVRSGRQWPILLAAFTVLLAAACTPRVQDIGPDIVAPALLPDGLVMPDGVVLPTRVWQPDSTYPHPRGIILALHGYNDYSRAFALPAPAFTGAGFLVYAYDQRGFGATRDAGIWAGAEVLVADAGRAIAMIRAAYPDLPLYVLGESMGGAVATVAAARSPVPVDGVVLVAPAFWGWRSLNVVEGLSLELMTWLTPWLPLTGRGLDITPSDNIEVLRELSADPLVLKESRVDSIFGLVSLMDIAYQALADLDSPVLMLYGGREDILPSSAIQAAVDQLERCRPANAGCAPRVAFYEHSYHLMLRDLNAPVVLGDIVGWIASGHDALPSGAGGSPPVAGGAAQGPPG